MLKLTSLVTAGGLGVAVTDHVDDMGKSESPAVDPDVATMLHIPAFVGSRPQEEDLRVCRSGAVSFDAILRTSPWRLT